MYLYIIFFILSFFVLIEIAQNRKKVKNQYDRFIYSSFVLLFFVLSACRWENGTDWDSYFRIWLSYPEITAIGVMEPAYMLLSSFNYWLVDHYSFHIFIMAIICIIPVSIINYKYSPYPIFSLFIWYVCNFAHVFNVRQTIAISLIFCAIPYLLNRNKRAFITTVIIATLFHKTAFIALPIYWIWNMNIKKSKAIIILIICSILSLLLSKAFSKLLFILGGGLFEEQLNFYLGENSDSTFGQQYSPIQVLIRGLINRSFILIIGFYLLNRLRNKSSFINGIINIYFFGTILFIMFTPLSMALSRFANYYDIFQIILIPCLFLYKMKKELRLGIFVFLSLYLCYRFRGVVFNYEDLYIPYKFFFLETF